MLSLCTLELGPDSYKPARTRCALLPLTDSSAGCKVWGRNQLRTDDDGATSARGRPYICISAHTVAGHDEWEGPHVMLTRPHGAVPTASYFRLR